MTQEYDNKQILREAKRKLIARLAQFELHEEGMLIVAEIRKSRPGVVGYYSSMSQFRGRARIVVDVDAIRREMASEAAVEFEVLKTLSHEYGHILAECFRFHYRQRTPGFVVPRWENEFDNEEDFAEDFARFLCGQSSEAGFHEHLLSSFVEQLKRMGAEDEDAELEEISHAPTAP